MQHQNVFTDETAESTYPIIFAHLSSWEFSVFSEPHTWGELNKRSQLILNLYTITLYCMELKLRSLPLQDIVGISFNHISFYLGQDHFTHFEPSQSVGGTKTGDPREKPPDHPHIWPELGSNPQRWDDQRFRALKISGLNHSATGAAHIKSRWIRN